MRVAIYTRVSTAGRDNDGDYRQNPDLQLQALESFAAARQWTITHRYSDRESGSKDRRPGLDLLMADARARKFQAVVVWKFDRFARHTAKAVLALDEFRQLGVDFISATEPMDTTTPLGRAMFGVLAIFAELERETIRERVRAGIVTARAKGVDLGRPRRHVDVELARMLHGEGRSWAEVAAQMGVGRATLMRTLRGAKTPSQNPTPAAPRILPEKP